MGKHIDRFMSSWKRINIPTSTFLYIDYGSISRACSDATEIQTWKYYVYSLINKLVYRATRHQDHTKYFVSPQEFNWISSGHSNKQSSSSPRVPTPIPTRTSPFIPTLVSKADFLKIFPGILIDTRLLRSSDADSTNQDRLLFALSHSLLSYPFCPLSLSSLSPSPPTHPLSHFLLSAFESELAFQQTIVVVHVVVGEYRFVGVAVVVARRGVVVGVVAKNRTNNKNKMDMWQ